MAKQPVNSTPPNPGDIASVKPKADKPWCPNCRAHTHYKTKTRERTIYQSADDHTKPPTRTETDYFCRHCTESMFIPSSAKVFGCAVGIGCGTAVWGLLVVAIFTLFPPEMNNPGPNLGISLILGGHLLTGFGESATLRTEAGYDGPKSNSDDYSRNQCAGFAAAAGNNGPADKLNWKNHSRHTSFAAGWATARRSLESTTCRRPKTISKKRRSYPPH